MLRKRRYCAPRYVRLRSKVEAPTRCCGRAVDYMASPSSKQLQVYGNLTDLAKTIVGTKTNDGAGHPNRHFTS